MARVAGIKFEKDTKGENRFVRIDLKKHGKEINPFLENIGAVETDDFEQLWANAITGEELCQKVNEHLLSLDWSNIGEKK